MLGSTVVEVAIGLALIFLTFSLLCSTISEWIARFLALRATGLAHGISELFDNATFTQSFHAHALIDALRPSHAPVLRRIFGNKDTARYPSYISAKMFALAVMDLATDVTSPGMPGVATRATLKAVPDTVPKTVAALLRSVDGDAAAMEQRLEDWFNDSMSRVSGWYKRRTQVILFVIALVLSLVLNIDTFSLVRQLVTEPAVREALVEQAGAIVQQAQTHDSTKTQLAVVNDSLSLNEIHSRIDRLQHAGLVSIGSASECSMVARFSPWSSVARSPSCDGDFEAISGILLTAIALSFGAPFWFDALSKLANLRQAGPSPDDSKS